MVWRILLLGKFGNLRQILLKFLCFFRFLHYPFNNNSSFFALIAACDLAWLLKNN